MADAKEHWAAARKRMSFKLEGGRRRSPSVMLREGFQEALAESQKKAFRIWVNTVLAKRDLVCTDLVADFADGLTLINLVEILTNRGVGRYNKNPSMQIQKMENIGLALKTMEDVGIRHNCSAEAVIGLDVKNDLSIVWALIRRYQLASTGEENGAKADLLAWLKKQIGSYPRVLTNNFTTNFSDGLAFSALMHSLHPDSLDFSSIKPTAPEENMTRAFQLALERCEIPQLLEPDDIVHNPDELSVMTYVSYFRAYAEKQGLSAPEMKTREMWTQTEGRSVVDVAGVVMEARLAAKQQEIDDERHTMGEQRAALAAEVAGLEEQLADLTDVAARERQQLAAARAELEVAGEARRVEVVALNLELSTRKEDLSKAAAHSDRLNQEMRALVSERDATRAELVDARKEQERLQQLHAKSQAELAQQRQDAEKRIAALSGELQTQTQTQEARSTDLSTQLATAIRERDAARDLLGVTKSEVDQLKVDSAARLAALTAELEALKAARDADSKQADRTTSDLASQLAAMMRERDATREQLVLAQSQASQSRSTSDTLDADLKRVSKNNAELLAQLASMEQQRDALSEQLTASLAELSQAKSTFDAAKVALDADLKRATRDNSDLTAQLATMTRDRDSLREQYTASQSEGSQTKNNFVQQLASVNAELQAVKSASASDQLRFAQENTASADQLATLSRDRDALRQQLSLAQSEAMRAKNDFSEQLASLRAELQAMTTTREAEQKRYAQDAAMGATQLASVTRDRESARDQVQAAQAEIVQLKNDAHALGAESDRWRRTCEQRQAELAALRESHASEIARSQVDAKILEETLAREQATSLAAEGRHTAEVDGLKQALLRQQLEATNERQKLLADLDALREELEDWKGKHADEKRRSTESGSKTQGLRATVEANRAEMQRLSAEALDRERVALESKAAVERLEARLTTALSDLQAKRSECDRTTRELEAAASARDDAVMQRDDLEHEGALLRQQLESGRQSLVAVQRELEDTRDAAIRAMQHATEESQEEIASHRLALERANELASSADARTKAAERNIADMTSKCHVLTDQLRTEREQTMKVQASNAELAKQLAQADVVRAELEAAGRARLSEKQLADSQIAALNGQLERLNRELSAERDDGRARVAALQLELQSTQETVKRGQEALARCADDAKRMSTELTEHVTKLQTALDGTQERYLALQQSSDANSRQLGARIAELERLLADVGAHSTAAQVAADATLTQLRLALKESERTASEAQATLERLQRSSAEQLQAATERAAAEQLSLQTELEAARRLADGESAAKHVLEGKLESATSALKNAMGQVAVSEQTISQLQNDINVLRTQHGQITEALQSSAGECARLEGELRTARDRIAAQDEAARLSDIELAALRERVQRLEAAARMHEEERLKQLASHQAAIAAANSEASARDAARQADFARQVAEYESQISVLQTAVREHSASALASTDEATRQRAALEEKLLALQKEVQERDRALSDLQSAMERARREFADAKAELDARMADLQHQLDEAGIERASLQRERDRLTVAAEESEAARRRLQTERDVLQTQLESQRKAHAIQQKESAVELDRLRRGVEEKERALASEQQASAQLASELGTARAELATQHDVMEGLTQRMSEREKEIDDLRRSLEASNQQVQSRNKDLAQLRDTCDRQTRSLADRDAQVARLEEEVNELRRTIAALQLAGETLKTDHAKVAASLEGGLATSQNTIADLQAQLSAQTSVLESTRAMAAAEHERLLAANADVDQLRAALEAKADALRNATSQVEGLQANLLRLRETVRSLEEQLGTAKDREAAVTAECLAVKAAHDARLHDLGRESDSVSARAAEMASALDGARAHIADLEARLASYEKETRAQAIAHQQLTEQLAAETTKVATSRQRATELEQQLQDARTQIDELMARLAAALSDAKRDEEAAQAARSQLMSEHAAELLRVNEKTAVLQGDLAAERDRLQAAAARASEAERALEAERRGRLDDSTSAAARHDELTRALVDAQGVLAAEQATTARLMATAQEERASEQRSFSEKLARLEQELAAQKAHADKLEEHMRAARDEANGAHQVSRDRESALQAEIASLREQMTASAAAADGALASMRQRAADAERARDQWEAQCTELGQLRVSLEKELNGAQARLADRDSQLAQAVADASAREQSLQAELAAVRSDSAKLQTELSASRESIAALKAELVALQGSNERAGARIDQLEATARQIATDHALAIATGRAELTAAQGGAEKLGSELASARSDATFARTELSVAREQIAHLHGALADAQAAGQRSAAEAGAHVQTLTGVNAELVAARESVARLQADLAAAREDTAGLRADYATSRDVNTRLQADLAASLDKVGRCEADISSLHGAAQTAVAEKAALEAMLVERDAALAQNQRDIAVLNQRVNELTSTLHATETQWHERVARLEQQASAERQQRADEMRSLTAAWDIERTDLKLALDAALAERSKATLRVDELTRALAASEAILRDSQHAATDSASELEQRLAEAHALLREAKDKLAKQEINEKVNWAKLQSELASARSTVVVLTTEKSTLANQVRDLSAQLADLQRRYRQALDDVINCAV